MIGKRRNTSIVDRVKVSGFIKSGLCNELKIGTTDKSSLPKREILVIVPGVIASIEPKIILKRLQRHDAVT